MQQLIVPIIEGDGEIEAVPMLIRRVLLEQLQEHEIQVAAPKKLHRNAIDSNLPVILRYAANEEGCGAIIVMMDADKDCPQQLASKMSSIASQQNIAMPVAMVCPNVEYEAWLIASIDVMRGHSIGHRKAEIELDASCPEDVEGIRDAKGWLSEHMIGRRSYKPTQDQAPLTAWIDLQLAVNRSRSFKRLCHAVEEVVAGIRSGTADVTPPASP